LHITVINLHSSHNLGDAAITLEMIQQLQENFPTAQMTLVMNDPISHPAETNMEVVGSFKTWVLALDKQRREIWKVWSFPWQLLIALVALVTYRYLGRPLFLTRNPEKQRLLQTYFDTDLVISCGGQVLATKRWWAISFYWIVFSTLYAYWLGKPIYMFPQTIGPVATWHHRVLINFVLSRTRLIMVRDKNLSTKIMTAPDLAAKVITLPDAAFGLKGRTAAQGWAFLQKFGLYPQANTPTIGLTLMNWAGLNVTFQAKHQHEYEMAVAELLQYIVRDLHGRAFLFGQVTGPSIKEDDREVAKRVMARSGLSAPDVVLLDISTVDDMLTAYATLDMLIGTRMHSTIMALVSQIPVCAIGYMAAKTEGSLQWAGLGEAVCSINNLTAAQLIAFFQTWWSRQPQTKQHLAQTIPLVAQQAKLAGKAIAEDWLKLQPSLKPRKKILIIISSFAIEGPQGGVERFVIELATHLDLTRLDLTICGLWYHGLEYEHHWMNYLSQRGIKVLTTTNWTGSTMHDAVASCQFLTKYLQNQPPFEVINSHAAFPDVVALLMYAQGKTQCLLRTVHNEREWARRPMPQLLLNQFLAPFFFKAEWGVSQKVVSNLNDRFITRLRGKKAQVVYNSINLNRLRNIKIDTAVKKQALGLPLNVPLIGTVGRVVEQKGQVYFLAMAQKVLVTHPQCHFLIVGMGELLPQLKAQAFELGIASHIHFLGARTDVEEILAMLDIFVSSSLWEGLATVILEAMAASIPVVATEVSGSVELIQSGLNGILVPAKNAEALSQAVGHLLDHPHEANLLSQNAQQRVNSFDITQIAQIYEAFFINQALILP